MPGKRKLLSIAALAALVAAFFPFDLGPWALNLRRALAGGVLEPHRPPLRWLNLISCGGRRAIVSWGSLAAEGAWARRWKNRIDRAWVARFSAAATRAGGSR